MSASVVYCVDSRNAIESVAGAWSRFAEENGAPELRPEAVLGRPLTEFLAGGALQRLWCLLLDRVREHGRARTLPFRCDSPDARRFMELELRLLDRGRVEHRSRLLRSESRDPVARVHPGARRGEGRVVVCSMCKRIEDPVEGWQEAERALALVGELPPARQPSLDHGLCDGCAASLERAAEA